MTIGFDADDTLWVNEKYYHEVENNVEKLLKPWFHVGEIKSEMFKTEMSNLELFGYGAKGFTLSLVETALRITDNQISGEVVGKIIDLGKELIKRSVTLLDGVEETLSTLDGEGHKLIFITKGDLLDQKRKLKKSGLEQYFDHVEVMSGKKESDYAEFFRKLGINLKSFLMVGDSLKSDILPVINLGGWAVHVPGGSTWEHEQVEEDISHDRFIAAENIREVVTLIKKIEKNSDSTDTLPIKIYTDGGCSGNPGPGGWAYILSAGSFKERHSGGDKHTTNNKMELTAVIKALQQVRSSRVLHDRKVEIYTDSQYVRNGISSWIHTWVKNGWKTASGQFVKNKELWVRLKELSDGLDIAWKWVKGHAGDPLNEACDEMVKAEMEKIK